VSVIYVLITVSLIIAVIFFIAFISAVRSGQFDDAVTPSIRMLFEDKSTKINHPNSDSHQKSRDSKPLDKS